MKSILKKILRRLLGRKAAPAVDRSMEPMGWGRGFEKSLRLLKLNGLKVDYVYDVGAALGTPWLYEAFTEAKHLLFEPLPFQMDTLRQTYGAQSNFEFFETALGPEEGDMEIFVYKKATGSGFFEPTDVFKKLAAQREIVLDKRVLKVAISPLDNYLREGALALKLDVEGYKMKVMKSGEQLLKQTKAIIIEMSVLPRLKGEASFAEMVAFLDAKGFQLFDISGLYYPARDYELSFLDAIFVRKEDELHGRWMD